MNDKVRNPGKTKKDKLNGCMERSLHNKNARAEWQQDSSARGSHFPLDTCNGKRSQKLKNKKAKKR